MLVSAVDMVSLSNPCCSFILGAALSRLGGAQVCCVYFLFSGVGYVNGVNGFR